MRAFLALLACLSFHGLALAQEDDSQAQPFTDGEPNKPEPQSEEGFGSTVKEEDDFGTETTEAVPLLSSVRENKSFGIGMRYGLLVAPVPGLGFDAFYQLRPNWQVGLLFFQGSQDLKNHLAATDGTTTEKHVLSANLNLIYSRYFIGDSWYVTGALGQRVVKTNYELRSTTVNSFIRAHDTATSTVLTVAVGNMWTWSKGFYAAIDWLGYSQPLASKEDINTSTTGTSAPPSALEKKRKEVEDLFKDTGRLGTWLYLGFHLGYTF